MWTPSGDDAAWMRRALDLAGQARGRTAPNPMVGAVVVRDGVVIADGFHHGPGQKHAEVDALSKLAPGDAVGCTMYVNLEPCCHYGRTPPCTDAILAAGLSRVVVGMVDPDERVRGQGIAIMRQAGVVVDVGALESECRSLNEAYICARERDRPLVVLKAAASLDGRIADAYGQSQWITGAAARQVGHGLRDRHDAILVGSGTLLADDPALTTRVPGGRDALPVIIDTGLRCPVDARVLSAGRRPVIYCAPDAPLRALPADIVRVPRALGGLDMSAVLGDLLARGVHSVLVEGGGQIHRSLIALGLADRVHLFLAPRVLAGGPAWVADAGFALADAPAFRVQSVRIVGDDVHLQLER